MLISVYNSSECTVISIDSKSVDLTVPCNTEEDPTCTKPLISHATSNITVAPLIFVLQVARTSSSRRHTNHNAYTYATKGLVQP